MLFIVPLPLYCLSPPLFPNRTLLLRIALIPFGHFSRAKIKKQWKKFTSLSSQSVNFLKFFIWQSISFFINVKRFILPCLKDDFCRYLYVLKPLRLKTFPLSLLECESFRMKSKATVLKKACSSRRKYSAFSQGGILSETLTICKFKI